jgi:predicted ATPase with chaperone activity
VAWRWHSSQKKIREGILLPTISAREAAMVSDIPVYPIESLDQAVRFLEGDLMLCSLKPRPPQIEGTGDSELDFSEIKARPPYGGQSKWRLLAAIISL